MPSKAERHVCGRRKERKKKKKKKKNKGNLEVEMKASEARLTLKMKISLHRLHKIIYAFDYCRRSLQLALANEVSSINP